MPERAAPKHLISKCHQTPAHLVRRAGSVKSMRGINVVFEMSGTAHMDNPRLFIYNYNQFMGLIGQQQLTLGFHTVGLLRGMKEEEGK